VRRWLLYAGIFAGALLLGGERLRGRDVAKLSPVEVLYMDIQNGTICLKTDTGNVGLGENVTQALENMKKTTPGTVFLETADYLLVTEKAADLIGQLRQHLRPNCGVCIAEGEIQLEKIAEYLNAHEPEVSLQELRTGSKELPVLTMEKGRAELVQ